MSNKNASENVAFSKKKSGKILNYLRSHMAAIVLTFYDIITVIFSFLFALWLRFDFKASDIPLVFSDTCLRFLPIYTVFCIIVFYFAKTYRSVWSFVGFNELFRVILVTGITFIFHVFGTVVFFNRMPVSYYLIGIFFQFVMMVAARFSYRLFNFIKYARQIRSYKKTAMIIGAGSAGQMLLNEINRSGEYATRVCCFIDDNESKWGRYIDGVEIVGGRDDIILSVEKYHIDTIYFAISYISNSEKSEILNICNETGCKIQQLPPIHSIVEKGIKMSDLKEVSINDLLGREPIKHDMQNVYDFVSGKTIIVTGGGGSIGSELCRQIAARNPKTLIIFDVYENNAYDIQLELKNKYPNLDLVTLIGSVRDSRRLMDVFNTYHPDVVYHAAAHKHVPLMEDSPCEAIKNNAVGTYKTAYAAMVTGCKRFVLISTDKAVNPTNVMGASKRICEMIIQTFDRMIKNGTANKLPAMFTHFNDSNMADEQDISNLNPVTEFVAVRFGNVLGSNGSVIPIFKRQIASGGPITVTHPDIIRYFMTIPEAVSLVLQAGVTANGGEIFVLDMGKPVKIDSLARNLIKLSGLKPDVDIKIEYTGLRPGEKLFEEKLMAEEGMRKTDNELIHIGCPIPFDENEFLKQLNSLMSLAYSNDSEGTKSKVRSIVKTYHAPELTVVSTN